MTVTDPSGAPGAADTLASAATAADTLAPAESAHLHAIDVVRLLAVGAVIAVHTSSGTMNPDDLVAGAILTELHVTREVFLLLSAFVLAYSYRARPMRRMAFWRRRYPFVVVPYLTWTAIYLVADGAVGSPTATMTRFATYLLDGGARYHLYFLLVMLQLYAVFPWLLGLARRWHRHHLAILVTSASAQLAFAAAIHYRLRLPGLAGTWVTHPGMVLPSYQFYVIAGTIARLHFDELTRWCRVHARLIALGVLVAGGLGIGSYLVDISSVGLGAARASEVFQPVVVAESLAFTAGLFTFGLWLGDRVGPRVRRGLEVSSELSFGIYLIHPLVLQGLFAVAASTGLVAEWDGLASLLMGVAVLGLVVPLVYVVSAAAVSVVRLTPLSLPLSGRVARRPQGRATRAAALMPINPLPTDEGAAMALS